MAKMLGARVIGTVSTEAKAALATEAGADEIILYTSQDFEAEVKRLDRANAAWTSSMIRSARRPF